LAQYIIALIRNEERNEGLKVSLQEKLNEFFDVGKVIYTQTVKKKEKKKG
jgi:hypothetical protein